MKILVTGATGAVGQILLPQLIKMKCEVCCLVRQYSDLLPQGVTQINVNDFFGKTSINSASNFDVCVHLAAHLYSGDDSQQFPEIWEANLNFGLKLLERISCLGIKLFINTGTFAEYQVSAPNLLSSSFYAATKSAFRNIVEFYGRSFDFKVMHLVPYTVYGGEDRSKKVINYLLDSLASKTRIGFSPGLQKLDFIHISDVALAYIKILQADFNLFPPIQTFYAGTGISTSIRDLAILFEELFKKSANIEWGVRSYRKLEVMEAKAPINLNNPMIDWKPLLNLKEGIKKSYFVIN